MHPNITFSARVRSSAFTAARLNAQPLLFCASSQIVQDVKRRGVKVHPIDVHHSDWDATLEQARIRQSFHDVEDLC